MSPPIYRPRRPRASPLWQIVHHARDDFLAHYEARHRRIHGPLSSDSVDVVDQFYRCGDLAAGFTRLQCPDCGHEKLLAFTCKTRHFCPSCHQQRVRRVGDWIAYTVCDNLPHRQFVFTMPRPLRGIFRKRRKLLGHLFQVAIGCLRDWMRLRLDLPHGQLAAIAAVQTFGDYLVFHPHLHVLAATGLIDSKNRFHLMPVESIEPLAELFRHRFLATLLREKLITAKKARQLLGWKHSGFSLDAREKPVAAHDVEGRRRLAEYLLRAPFSLKKITWNQQTRSVIYRSKRSWRTKRNFEVFSATDFIAAAVSHIPPKNQQTVRYYGLYSNKRRGLDAKAGRLGPRVCLAPAARLHDGLPSITILPPPSTQNARALRPLWRDLILRVWGVDPLLCPCCKGTMKVIDNLIRPEEVEFFLRLLGLWEGVIALPPPPRPPFDIETMEPLHIPKKPDWTEDTESLSPDSWTDSEPAWKAPERVLDEERLLVLDGDLVPADDLPLFAID